MMKSIEVDHNNKLTKYINFYIFIILIIYICIILAFSPIFNNYIRITGKVFLIIIGIFSLYIKYYSYINKNNFI